MLHARSRRIVIADEKTAVDVPIGVDTPLRCSVALVFVRLGMRLVHRGTLILSPAHPARHAYGSAVVAWRDRTRMMPWRGFVPTSRRPATLTQLAWVIVAFAALNTAATFVGAPHVPVFRILTGHPLPHLAVTITPTR